MSLHTDQGRISDLPWYHGELTRHLAEVLLMSNGVDGSFLLRECEPKGEIYCISARGKGLVKHFKVERSGTVFMFGGIQFESLDSFLQQIANQPVLRSRATRSTSNYERADLVILKYPYPVDVQEPSDYDQVGYQGQLLANASEENLLAKMKCTPMATKSGFLTKQGAMVKSWKLRWFTCIRFELSYYEKLDSKKPIHIIDLKKCSRCYEKEIPGKNHSFCIEEKSRTWLFCAENSNDRREWLEVLKWKLENNSQSCCTRPA